MSVRWSRTRSRHGGRRRRRRRRSHDAASLPPLGQSPPLRNNTSQTDSDRDGRTDVEGEAEAQVVIHAISPRSLLSPIDHRFRRLNGAILLDDFPFSRILNAIHSMQYICIYRRIYTYIYIYIILYITNMLYNIHVYLYTSTCCIAWSYIYI